MLTTLLALTAAGLAFLMQKRIRKFANSSFGRMDTILFFALIVYAIYQYYTHEPAVFAFADGPEKYVQYILIGFILLNILIFFLTLFSFGLYLDKKLEAYRETHGEEKYQEALRLLEKLKSGKLTQKDKDDIRKKRKKEQEEIKKQERYKR